MLANTVHVKLSQAMYRKQETVNVKEILQLTRKLRLNRKFTAFDDPLQHCFS